MAGTEIEQGRKTKDNSPQHTQIPRPPQKEKNQGPPWVHAESSHWLHEISIFKTVRHHFWAGLMAGSVIWGHSKNKSWENDIPLGSSYSNICLFFVLEINLHLIPLMFSAIHPRPNLPARIASPLLYRYLVQEKLSLTPLPLTLTHSYINTHFKFEMITPSK